MPKKDSKRDWTKRIVQAFQRFSEWHNGIGVLIFVLVLALVTRTVNLSSFPYFPSNWPWIGVNGIFVDEYVISNLPFSNSAYFPFLQITLIGIAVNLLGYTTFAIRLVSALFSSATCVLVYLSANELFRKRLPAFLSSLYFIFMTPALVYGRMAFVENGATTFFVATFFFALKYLRTNNSRWLICAGVSAGLSFLCKQTGFASTIFLILFILAYKPESKGQLFRLVLIAGILGSIYFIQIMIVNPGYLNNLIRTYIYTLIGSVSWFSVFLFNLMPSGVSISWIISPQTLYDLYGFVTLDFWYIFAFFLIFYLLVKEREIVRPIILAILSYILILVMIGHANDYYVILIQPFMVIPLGYGILKLNEMPSLLTSAFSLLLCFPAAAYINYYVSYFLIQNPGDVVWVLVNIALTVPIVALGIARLSCRSEGHMNFSVMNRFLLTYYALWLIIGSYVVTLFPDACWVVIQFTMVVPVAIIGVIAFWNERMKREERIMINRFLLIFYVACLVVGSYLLPVFYPGYFAQTSVPT